MAMSAVGVHGARSWKPASMEPVQAVHAAPVALNVLPGQAEQTRSVVSVHGVVSTSPGPHAARQAKHVSPDPGL